MKYFFLSTFLSICFLNFSQNNSEFKLIEKILGNDFFKSKPEIYFHKTYPKNTTCDTSLILKYDTTGIHKNGEFILFRDPIIYNNRLELFKYVKKNYVSVDEYNDFVFWVTDSIVRETLFLELENDKEAHKLLEIHECSTECVLNRKIAREKYFFDWDTKIDYTNPIYMPILYSYLYLNPPERFYRQVKIDQRKLKYSYKKEYNEFPATFINDSRNFNIENHEIVFPTVFNHKDKFPQICHFETPIIPDYYLLASTDTALYSEKSCLSEMYESQYSKFPVFGLLGTQADAYCNWIEKKINAALSESKINLKALVTLPTENDLRNFHSKKITIPEFNYSELWQIKIEDYNKFVNYVRDSILQEQLFFSLEDNSEAIKLLDYKEIYFDEIIGFDSLNIDDRYFNRALFFLKKHVNLTEICDDLGWIDSITEDQLYDYSSWKNSIKYCDYLLKKNLENNLLIYSFYHKNIGAMGENGFFEFDEEKGVYIIDNKDERNKIAVTKYDEQVSVIKGKNLVLSETMNELGSNSGVRSIENLNEHLIARNQPIIICDNYLVDSSDTFMHISYENAIAYYSWKFPRWEMKNSNMSWQRFVLPTKEQYLKMQNGEKIIIPSHEVDYPTALFRYVVHFYK